MGTGKDWTKRFQDIVIRGQQKKNHTSKPMQQLRGRQIQIQRNDQKIRAKVTCRRHFSKCFWVQNFIKVFIDFDSSDLKVHFLKTYFFDLDSFGKMVTICKFITWMKVLRRQKLWRRRHPKVSKSAKTVFSLLTENVNCTLLIVCFFVLGRRRRRRRRRRRSQESPLKILRKSNE